MREFPVGWSSPSVLQFKGFKPAFLPSCKTSVLNLLMDRGSAQQLPWIRMDVTPSHTQGTYMGPLLCSSFPGHPHSNFFLRGTGGCCPGALGVSFLSWNGRHLLWKGHAFKHFLISEGEVTPHLFSELFYTLHQQVWPPSSRQIHFLHPKLKGSGICHHLFTLDFLNVPTSKDGGRWWQEVLLEKTWQCRWGLMVVLQLV